MEQSPWETNNPSDIQEIPRLVWEPKVHYRIHKSQPLVPNLSQLHPVHTFQPYFLRYILILSSHLRLGLPSGLFLSHFPTEVLYTFLISLMRATRPANLTLLRDANANTNTSKQWTSSPFDWRHRDIADRNMRFPGDSSDGTQCPGFLDPGCYPETQNKQKTHKYSSILYEQLLFSCPFIYLVTSTQLPMLYSDE
jgi:hypothetical protein